MLSWFVAATSIVALLLVAAFVLTRGARQPARWFLFSLLVTLAIFTFGLDLAVLTVTENFASIGYHIVFFSCILALPLYCEFVLSFLGIAREFILLRIGIWIAAALLSIPGLLRRYPVWTTDDQHWYPVYRLFPAFLPYAVIWLSTGAICLTLLWREYRKESGVRWRQLGSVFYGSIVAWLGATTSYGLIAGRSLFPAWDIAFVMMAIMLAYAMVAYRMLEVNVVIRQSIVYSIVSAVFAAAFWGTLMTISLTVPHWNPLLSGAVAFPFCFAIALLFHPLERRVQTFIDDLLFRPRQNIGEWLTRYTNDVADLRDRQSIITMTEELIRNALGCSAHVAVNPPQNASHLQCFPATSRRKGLNGSGGEVLLIEPRATGEPFVAEETDFISTVAVEMNLALEKCRLIEELEREQDQARKAERLAAMGAVVAGVIHDIRTPLAGIKLNAELLSEELENSDLQTVAADIVEATKKQETVLSELLTSVRPSMKREIVTIRDLLKDVQTEVRPLMRERTLIRFNVHSENDDDAFQGDKSELKRAIANLIANAMDSIDGEGIVSLKGMMCPTEECTYAQFEVRDTGCGIPEEHLRRIFEPLFTTKDNGTGLGLAIARRVVQAHQGSINVTSSKGKGTVFIIRIPIDEQ